MPCTPVEILKVAEKLSQSSDEAELRASISRSYYCAYHSCLNDRGITDTNTWVGGRGGIHQKLIDEYMHDGNKAIGYMLDNLKVKRTIADYKLTESLEKNDAQAMLRSVHRLLEKIHSS
ncbi:hypothetical protein [Candidatus Venteria ishoeyi]|uniref:HEPN domain-containing protein n=1 Tax=Candidatus Venteria ishoeyi TaxID=1899563 RepID=A0A1H6FAI0_9GAMM|nr:hypothetical protein [Candidatus Venteria ishoeyi]SEH07098.1 Uncharacterised protein [Candidatus Venteria ishoeyi]